jgi:hypothetical protein
MKSIVITIFACATAITWVILWRGDRTPEQSRYQLYGVDETSSANGKTMKSVYRVDTISGKTWRMSSNPVPIPVGGDPQHPTVNWADAWEEMSESSEEAVAKEQARWRGALEQARSAKTTEPPQATATPR